MNVGAIIFDVSRDLNDQVEGAPYIRWTQGQLHSYLIEAVVELSAIYEQLFHKKVVVRLRSGDVWQEACDCTHITRIIGESTWDGAIIRTLREMSDESVFTWPGEVVDHCRPADSELNGYSISSVKDSEFRVFPPVQPGKTKFVLVECYAQPSSEEMQSTDFDVPDRLVQAVKQWMLYRAMIVDSENNPAIIEVAKTHLQVYHTLALQELATESAKQEAERYASNSGVRAVSGSSSGKVSS